MRRFREQLNRLTTAGKATFSVNGGWLGPVWEAQALGDLYARGLVMDKGDYGRIVRAEKRLMQVAFDGPRPFTWDLERTLYEEGKLPFEIIPTYKQDTGNCVAASLVMAGQKRHVIELSLGRQEEEFHEWYIPWIYAVSRNQVGGGLNGDGSTGAWGAQAVSEYGVLFTDDSGVPSTAGYSDRWGDRDNVRNPEYGKFFDVARDNKVRIARLTSVEQIEESLEAGRMVTIASTQGFEMRPRVIDGFHVFRPSGTWYHQTSFCDVRRKPIHALYRCNQWGPDVHGEPLNGETPGGAWNLVEDVAAELKQRNVEVYSYFDFDGVQSEIDLGIL